MTGGLTVPTVEQILVPETLLKKKKAQEKLAAKSVVELKKKRKVAKTARRTILKRAEQYFREYHAAERDVVRLRRQAKACGDFYVPAQPKLAFVIRIKGINHIPPKPRKILQLLRLLQINNGIFLRLTKATKEMLQLVNPYVAYGEPNLKSVRELIYKRGHAKVDRQRIPITDNSIIQQSLGKFGITCFKQANNFLWPFKLSNPNGGWANRKFRHYVEGGDFGDREDKINALIINKSTNKDEKMEKLLKKAKLFFDQKQKPKTRATSLWNFIDVTNDLDQAQFFQEHAEDVFDVVLNLYRSQIEKIKRRPDRPVSFSSKEYININKTLVLLRKIFLFLPDIIKTAEMLSHILDHGNHPRLRIQGFQLLLLWMNDLTHEIPEFLHLYSNAISLDLFLYDQIRNLNSSEHNNDYRQDVLKKKNRSLILDQSLIKSDDRVALLPNPYPPTFTDSIHLLQVELSGLVRLAHVAAGSTPPPENYDFPLIESIEPDNGIAVGMGIDAALAAAKFHFELEKKLYLIKLFPQCAKKMGLLPENKDLGFQKCPPTILRALITFFIHHCLDNYCLSESITSYPSPATPILKSIVLGPENREFAHEIVKQALMLPSGSPLYKDIVRGAVHIVGVWTLSGEEERPTFLRKSATTHPQSTSTLPSNSSIISTDSHSESSFVPETNFFDANIYIRRYIQLLTLCFQTQPCGNAEGGMTNLEIDAQVSIYRDILSLFRSMIAEGPIELETETWEVLLVSLLEIQPKLMNQNNKSDSSQSATLTLTDELIDYLIEKIMLRLTKILSKYLHQVDLDIVELNKRLSELSTPERHFHRRRSSRNRTRHLSLRTDHRHKSSGSNSSREDVISSEHLSPKPNVDNIKIRKPLSLHQDMSSMEPKIHSSQTLLNIMSNGGGSASSIHSGTGDDAAEVKSNRTSSSSVFAQSNFSNERLSISLANFRSPEFINLESLSWDPENALLIWKNMLCALGNINHIQNVQNHADAIKCLVDILDMFILIKTNQYGNAPSPLFYEFIPWLFEACDLPMAFAPGRAFAYAGLCKLMSRRKDQKFNEEYFPHFYRTIIKGLSDNDYNVILAIINNSTKLFSQELPGANILYHSFIEIIRDILSKKDIHIPEITRQNAITILCSLICIISQVSSVNVPIISYNKLVQFNIKDLNGPEFDNLDDMSFSEIRMILKEILVSELSKETIRSYDTHIMLLYGITTFLLDEFTAPLLPNKNIIKECFHVILDQLYCNHLQVVTAAADCLMAVAQNSSLWREENEARFIIAKLFYCLLEWIMIIPPNIFTDTELCSLVLEVIDMAFDTYGIESPKFFKKLIVPSHKNKIKKPQNDTHIKFKKAERRTSSSNNYNNEVNSHVIGAENNVEDVNFVKDAAEFVLLHLTHHFGNFAPIHGPAMMNSTFIGPVGNDTKEEEVTEHYQYFSFNDTTIITLIEIPGEDVSISRIVIRDFSGRYSWDSKLFYKAFCNNDYKSDHESNCLKYVRMSDHLEFRPNIKIDALESKSMIDNNSKDKPKFINKTINSFKEKNTLPVYNNEDDVNMLDCLLQYVGEQVPHLPTIEKTNGESQKLPSETERKKMIKIEDQLNRHIHEESLYGNATDSQARLWYENVTALRNSIFQQYENNKIIKRLSRNPLYKRSTSYLSLGADFSLSKSFLPVLPNYAEKPLEPYQQSRLFLSHFGWLSPEALKEGTISLLNKAPGLFRDMRLLDKKHPREVIKVALLYVGPGQEDEQSILRNTKGSLNYDDFVSSLGWEIDLATHPGYLGGLERNSTNGTTSIYYCTSTIELIFHDVTKMPTDPNDFKQLKKKRHIGNDHVHIIFNEHNRDYRKSTIGGDFGNAQIVVNPLSNGLFSVEINRDHKIPSFGPLLNGMVISQNVLGPLVRMTAIQAFRNSLHHTNSTNTTMYQHPFTERALDISIIMNKHKNTKCNSYETFMSKIFVTDDS
ncbi:9335_t:CDS:10 [Entrophospora sp. SA101]|nr:9335_t:CDS:10 [Entrophospora sp. SA101]